MLKATKTFICMTKMTIQPIVKPLRVGRIKPLKVVLWSGINRAGFNPQNLSSGVQRERYK
jgi:hypothetical protein